MGSISFMSSCHLRKDKSKPKCTHWNLPTSRGEGGGTKFGGISNSSVLIPPTSSSVPEDDRGISAVNPIDIDVGGTTTADDIISSTAIGGGGGEGVGCRKGGMISGDVCPLHINLGSLLLCCLVDVPEGLCH
jgi:hypothetical protein